MFNTTNGKSHTHHTRVHVYDRSTAAFHCTDRVRKQYYSFSHTCKQTIVPLSTISLVHYNIYIIQYKFVCDPKIWHGNWDVIKRLCFRRCEKCQSSIRNTEACSINDWCVHEYEWHWKIFGVPSFPHCQWMTNTKADVNEFGFFFPIIFYAKCTISRANMYRWCEWDTRWESNCQRIQFFYLSIYCVVRLNDCFANVCNAEYVRNCIHGLGQ